MWQWPLSDSTPLYAYIFPKLIYPLNNISLSCSIYTTIVIAYERCTVSLKRVADNLWLDYFSYRNFEFSNWSLGIFFLLLEFGDSSFGALVT